MAASETIKLYAWPTPNGQKISIALEEMDLPYRVAPVNIGRGEQFDPEFLKISPNNKIPALTDPDGPEGKEISLFESGAILIYLAEKTGRFLSRRLDERAETLQWLMWQMGAFGPMLGQLHHFRNYAPERIDYALSRYKEEARRLYRVLDGRLAEIPYVAGDSYTIADMAIYPWAAVHEDQGIDIDKYKNVRNWLELNGDRPGVRRGMALLAEESKRLRGEGLDDEARRHLFGQGQTAGAEAQ